MKDFFKLWGILLLGFIIGPSVIYGVIACAASLLYWVGTVAGVVAQIAVTVVLVSGLVAAVATWSTRS